VRSQRCQPPQSMRTRRSNHLPSFTEVRERLMKQGLQLPLGSPEEFAALIAAESKRWGEVIRTGGIKLGGN
jgi:tripartite-type tricarboxylate transporter receptor subunit TctC